MNAQRELIEDEVISRDQASDLLIQTDPNVGLSKRKGKKPLIHNEDDVDEEIKAKMVALVKAQHMSSKPVRGREDIPISGPRVAHGPNQSLTYAEQMLLSQAQRSDAPLEHPEKNPYENQIKSAEENSLGKKNNKDKNAKDKTKSKSSAFMEEFMEEMSYQNKPEAREEEKFELEIETAIDPSTWKKAAPEENTYANNSLQMDESLEPNASSAFRVMNSSKAKLYVPQKLARVKWNTGNKKRPL